MTQEDSPGPSAGDSVRLQAWIVALDDETLDSPYANQRQPAHQQRLTRNQETKMPPHPKTQMKRQVRAFQGEQAGGQSSMRLPPTKIIRYRMLPPLPEKIFIFPGQSVGTAGFEPTTP
ncbi:hypothetical protein [Micromonospora lupini]|uniref:Uncharacterized protein n=1 Tax=Micromonospora lupini str. Lupac 08 TaxID=1150864 RepID=I0L1Y6_9ACTN|nr:hypothetical protein [Micromonospora lupini]CCH17833.1 hypothetical protein MILUP08_42764 [Micromonospora lupini str. Lupac 08]